MPHDGLSYIVSIILLSSSSESCLMSLSADNVSLRTILMQTYVRMYLPSLLDLA